MILLEKTEKFICSDEQEAELFIEKIKEEETDCMLLDYKVSIKETKDSAYCLLTTKKRYKTLAEGKESLNG